MKHTTINNCDNLIDSRAIIARIKELTDERELLADAVTEAQQTLDDFNDPTSAIDEDEREDATEQRDNAEQALDDWDDSEEGEELKALNALAEQCDYGDWEHGETLIADDYFVTYAQELADEIGAIPKGATWPITCIDWDQAADELQRDYTQVEFDGNTYWIRS